MSTIRKRKRLLYQRATWLNDGDSGPKHTLQSALAAALEKLTLPAERKQESAEEDKQTRVLMLHRTLGEKSDSCLCGVVCHYSPGHNQAVVAPDPKAKEWTVAQVRPPKLDGKEATEFVESFLFFAVCGNHVMIATSAGLSVKQLGNYLDQLIRVQAKVVPDTRVLTLQEALSSDVKKHGVENVKALRIARPLGDIIAKTPPADSRRKKPIISKVLNEERFEGMMSFLEGFGLHLDRKEIDKSDGAEIEAVLEIRVTGRSQEELNTVLREAGDSATEQNDANCTIVLKDGTEIQGSKLRVQTWVNVDTDNGVARPAAMFSELAVYLADVIKSGLVDV